MNITWKDIAVGACILVVGIGSYVFIDLARKVDQQNRDLQQLSKQFAILVGVLSTKMPTTNLPALISIAVKNNISPEDISLVVPLLEKEPIQAKIYLKSQLYFNQKEIDLITKPMLIKKINFQNEK